jgi:hypothetical protein
VVVTFIDCKKVQRLRRSLSCWAALIVIFVAARGLRVSKSTDDHFTSDGADYARAAPSGAAQSSHSRVLDNSVGDIP